MPTPQSRIPFSSQYPYRKQRPATSKIIFLSCEGSVTEEEYFERVSEIFAEVKSKIQLISVVEDALHIKPKYRTPEQIRLLTKNRPLQLVQRIDQFKKENEEVYQFSLYPDDEFWVITDVDKNWSTDVIDKDGKTYREEWDEAIAICNQDDKKYRYAISNPFFEMWLLLHHVPSDEADEVFAEAKEYAVTDRHPYTPTDFFRNELSRLNARLDNKHIKTSDYTEEKIRLAVKYAEELHTCKDDLCPKYFATTVYLLLQKIIALLPESDSTTTTV